MPPFRIGDAVVFVWCKGQFNAYLIGNRATVIDIFKSKIQNAPDILQVLFENGEIHGFYSDRFKFFEGDSNKLLRNNLITRH